MKALLRLIVLCFFLFQFGGVFAHQKTEVNESYNSVSSTYLPGQHAQKESSTYFCQTEVDLEVHNSVDVQDNYTNKVAIERTLQVWIVAIFNLGSITSVLGEYKTSAFLQQHRAKYLLFRSLKIPYELA